MKKCYLLLCPMALTSLLLICNSVLAEEQNSEDDRWKALEEVTAKGAAETGSLIGAAAASVAAAEIANQGFKDYGKITQVDEELKEGINLMNKDKML